MVTAGGNGIQISDVDVSHYTSWVNGKLEFTNESLESVMKKLARWYNFEYAFENVAAKNYHFTGRLDNQEKISTILSMLELTTDVKFSIDEEKITIK